MKQMGKEWVVSESPAPAEIIEELHLGILANGGKVTLMRAVNYDLPQHFDMLMSGYCGNEEPHTHLYFKWEEPDEAVV